MREEETALVILASGLSQRFGRSNKLTAHFRGKPLIQHIIDSCKSINFGKRFAVVPSKPSALHDLLMDNGFTLIENNRRPSKNPSSTSSALTGPTPAGVPVKIMSPIFKVKN